MTTLSLEERAPAAIVGMTPARVAFDVVVLAWRNLVKFSRNTRLMLLSTVQPLTQLVLFAYVFNGVAALPHISYKEFVIPAVLVQTVTLAAMRTGIAVAADLDSGMMDRFRSLPIARSAVLLGRTVSDTLRLGIQTVVIMLVALAIGFHFRQGVLPAVGVVFVVVAFGMALTAFAGWVGLCVADPETAQTSLMVPVLPLVFVSSAFAPISKLPHFMQTVAEYNPVTAAVDLSRGLAIGGPLLSPFIHFVVWTTAITVVFTTLGVRRFRRG